MMWWLEHKEFLWLFIILSFDLLASMILIYYARRQDKWAEKEFKYDEEWNNRMIARKARRTASKKEPIPVLEKEMD